MISKKYKSILFGIFFLLNWQIAIGQFYSIEVPPTDEVRNWSFYGSGIEFMDDLLIIGAPFGGDWSPNEEHVFAMKSNGCEWVVLHHWKSATFSSDFMGAKIGVNTNWVALSENKGGCKINLFKFENDLFTKKAEISGGYCALTHFSNLAMDDEFFRGCKHNL